MASIHKGFEPLEILKHDLFARRCRVFVWVELDSWKRIQDSETFTNRFCRTHKYEIMVELKLVSKRRLNAGRKNLNVLSILKMLLNVTD